MIMPCCNDLLKLRKMQICRDINTFEKKFLLDVFLFPTMKSLNNEN